MPFFKSNDLKIWTGGEWKQLPKDITINKFSTDTRTLEKGDAFVCLVGERDGHEFAKTAQELGASAIIASKELEGIEIPVLQIADTLKALQTIAKMHRLRLDYPVVGITGSCGKTFTKELLAKTLAWRSPCYSEKNLNNQLGVALSLLKADCKNNNLAIIEAGVSRPEEMDVLASMIEPDIAVITNVTASHLAGFGEIKQIAKEKAKLAEHCAEGGYCVMPASLLSWKSFDELKCKKAIALPMDAPETKADLVFRYQIGYLPDKCSIEIYLEGGNEYSFETPLMSRGNAEDTVLAIIVSLMLGCKEEIIYTGIENTKNVGYRNLFVNTPNAEYFIDCYNANPTSMKDSLEFFELKSKDATQRTFVLGSMAELGISTLSYHREIANNIKRRENDKAILVGESANIYKDALIENGWNEADITLCESAQDVKPLLENAVGFVFLKGSRKYALENALPDEVVNTINGTEPKSEEPANEEKPEDETPPSPSENDDEPHAQTLLDSIDENDDESEEHHFCDDDDFDDENIQIDKDIERF